MYTICMIMFVCSIASIISSMLVLACNSWQKKNDKKNYDEGITKIVIKLLPIGIGGFIVSGLLLLII